MIALIARHWLPIGLAVLAGAAFLTAGVERSRRLQAQSELVQLELAVQKQKTDAAAMLATETGKVRDLEGKLSSALAEQNQKDATNAKTVSDLTRKLAVAGRLRDPHAGLGTSGSCTKAPDIATTDSGSADTEQAPGLLSKQTSDDLRALAREADEINAAYISCRADSIRLRELLAR